MPKIDVNPGTYEVRADGDLLHCDPAEVLPLTQRILSLLGIMTIVDKTISVGRNRSRACRLSSRHTHADLGRSQTRSWPTTLRRRRGVCDLAAELERY
jgi:hypothetical protein